MNEQIVFDVGQGAFRATLLLAGPPLTAALLVGLVVSIVQAVTQIQEVTLTFVPKIIAVFVAIAIFGPWMLQSMLGFTAYLFGLLPSLAR